MPPRTPSAAAAGCAHWLCMWEQRQGATPTRCPCGALLNTQTTLALALACIGLVRTVAIRSSRTGLR